jgi:site-specific DNA recombinase
VEVRKQYLGSNTAYGFHYIRKDQASGTEGLLELAPEEASVVRQMFEWVDRDGLSARRVLNRLNELKIRPRKGAALWGKSSVLRILRSEMYAGVWHYNKFQGCEPQNPVTSQRYRRRRKCSIRQRPKSEWLPLVLPDSLQIIPRERWERVQLQLNRNITFSPRNEKHGYLLKGLVRCGACKARYTGDPCHGKFYYRCLARCKNQPIVREAVLDETVKDAIKTLMLNPDVIIEPLRQLDEAEERQRGHQVEASHEIEVESNRLKAEEDRIFEAYRTGIISPSQLGQQLEQLKARKTVLDLRRSDIQPKENFPSEQVGKAVEEYCAEASRNFATLTPEEWREFLRTIIETIVFCGDHIKIRGRISLSVAKESGGEQLVEVPVTPSDTYIR